MSDYQPISCAAHSELELHIMRRQSLRVRWRGEEGERDAVLLPVDVTAERGAEYLHLRGGEGEVFKIRLDALLSFDPLGC